MSESKEKYVHPDDAALLDGRYLTSPLPGDEIVVSGMAGIFPESNNMHEFFENLFNEVNLMTTTKRWDFKHPGMPERIGLMPDIQRYDAGFFGQHFRQAENCDPMLRMLQERAVEATIDAGLHPSDLANTKTGVYLGSFVSDTENVFFHERASDLSFFGASRSVAAHMISAALKIKGPAYTTDTACSASLTAFENAFRDIRMGVIDAAFVGGSNVCTHPIVSLESTKLGVLSSDGLCKVFDERGNGYGRSEAITVILLQKVKDAKRIYGEVLHAKTNSDGFKISGLTFPSSKGQKRLLQEFYNECQIDPHTVGFVEAHGTGTYIGDPEECSALDDVFAKGRSTPLLIGSIKSNMGHSEGASGVCSIIKGLIGLHTGFIPPNINFSQPRKEIAGLMENRFKVVTKKTPFEDNYGLTGVNGFGFGGSNCHVLLKKNFKNKSLQKSVSTLPKLVCISGRTEDAVNKFLDGLKKNMHDYEHVRLVHDVFRKNIENHKYRGYILSSNSNEFQRKIAFIEKNKQYCLVFGELNNWLEIAKNLSKLSLFSDIFNNVKSYLDDLLSSNFEKLQNNFLGSLIIHIAITEMLTLLNVKLEVNYDNVYGQLMSAYVNGKLSLRSIIKEATILSSNIKKLDMNKNKPVLKLINSIDDNVMVKIGTISIDTSNENEITEIFSSKDYLKDFYLFLGRLYLEGYNPQLSKLEPEVQFPVSRGTEMISPYIGWNHSRKWFVPEYKSSLMKSAKSGTSVIQISLSDKQWGFLDGHVIDSRVLFPATGYLILAWQTYAMMKGTLMQSVAVTMEDCRFLRATTVPKNGSVKFQISITGNGQYEITEGDSLVSTGRVSFGESETFSNINSKMDNCKTSWMSSKDFYKELRLRGYYYKKGFKGIQQCALDGSMSTVRWEENWITFLDNMLQLSLIQCDTNLLYVPIHISKIVIDAQSHNEYVKNHTEKDKPVDIPIYCNVIDDTISTNHIRVWNGIKGTIGRKRDKIPVLEKYIFVPNIADLKLEDSVRVNIQIILENLQTLKINAIEVLDEATPEEVTVLGPIIQSVLKDQAMIKSDITVLTDRTMEISVPVENRELKTEKDRSLIIGWNLLERPEVLETALSCLAKGGYVISRETNYQRKEYDNITIVTEHNVESETLVLLKKAQIADNFVPFKITSTDDFSWIQKLQDKIKQHKNKTILLYSQCEPTSGILGLVTCLKREPETSNIRCLFIMDVTYDFDPDHKFFKEQLEKNLTINVIKHGLWGTYRHLPINKINYEKSEHCFVTPLVRGDLSTLKWVQGPLHRGIKSSITTETVHVNYAAMNFRDVMTASGNISPDVLVKDRLYQHCVEGVEFSGRDERGNRVMGTTGCRGLTSIVRVEKDFLQPVPDYMSLKEAATIPFTYNTAIYALIIRGKIKKGETILIHSAAGGIGQAAIVLALDCGCDVFVTVGTDEKREFLKKTFPQIKDSHIGNSHDLSYQKMIMKETKGRGVDVVLNSLIGEHIFASIRCLAKYGRFYEIGKIDLISNRNINLMLLAKHASYHGIMMEAAHFLSPQDKQRIIDFIKDGLERRMIKPLNVTLFKYEEIEQAFRYMGSGKHIGKVLIEVRPEEDIEERKMFPCVSRFIGDVNKSYIVIGGLGGMGLEVTDWLIIRGARNIIVTSRSGITTGYQELKLKRWVSYGVTFKIFNDDVATPNGCKNLLEKAQKLAPVDGIFNLAVVLSDAIFENQNVEKFMTSFKPKVDATKNLDEMSRIYCPTLKHFVVFSSISCGRGNAGQTNYGMANSVMERICEKRKSEGYPAVAIQWGAIGDVGLLAELQKDRNEMEIGGTLQQKISSCLNALDSLLLQQESAVVASMVVAEKKDKGEKPHDVVDAILNILGVNDKKSISLHTPLAEMGMDSMTAIEIKQTLEMDFEMYLNPKEMRTLTLTKLKEIQNQNKSDNEKKNKEAESGLTILFGNIINKKVEFKPIIKMVSKDEEVETPVIFFPGIEGISAPLETLASETVASVHCLQYPETINGESIQDMAKEVLPLVTEVITKLEPFKFVAHSFGGLLALEVAHLLEGMGYSGKVFLIESSINALKNMIENTRERWEGDFESYLTYYLLSFQLTQEELVKYKKAFTRCENWQQRLDMATKIFKGQLMFDIDYQKSITEGFKQKNQFVITYKPTYSKLNSKVHLVKAEGMDSVNKEVDYGLSSQIGQDVKIHVAGGDHNSVLENTETATLLNKWLLGY